MRWIHKICLLVAVMAWPLGAAALELEDDDAYVRVVDVGQGHCCIARLPGPFYMVYDTGPRHSYHLSSYKAENDPYWANLKANLEEIIEGNKIDLLVLSHSDADHIAQVENILSEYTVEDILYPFIYRVIEDNQNKKHWVDSSKYWQLRENTLWAWTQNAIDDHFLNREDHKLQLHENWPETSKDNNVAEYSIPLGSGWSHEDYDWSIYFVAGFGRLPDGWGVSRSNASKFHNAGSVVLLLEYDGTEILFTGDAVGFPNDESLGTEGYLHENCLEWLNTDICIAPHHGSEEGNTAQFIADMSPNYVIFPAGSGGHEHPRANAVDRYLANFDQRGLSTPELRVFRTDRCDNEGPPESDIGGVGSTDDGIDDDDVEILIRPGSSTRKPKYIETQECD